MYPLMVYYFVRGCWYLCYIATFTPSDAFILNSGQQSTGHGIAPALGDGNAFFVVVVAVVILLTPPPLYGGAKGVN
uniref:Putative secreted peptide n=1 Tax=Anopheles braziliensis TaxID=58242 RepID=A0A2M3ZSL5_9DIPT